MLKREMNQMLRLDRQKCPDATKEDVPLILHLDAVVLHRVNPLRPSLILRARPPPNPPQHAVHGEVDGVLPGPPQLGRAPVPPVQHPRRHLQHALPHPPHLGLRHGLERLGDPDAAEHHGLLGNVHRELVVPRGGQVPTVLPPRREVLEEDGHAAGEDGVERGPPRRRVPRRLQAELGPQHGAHVPAGVVRALAAGAIHDGARVGAVRALGEDGAPDVGPGRARDAAGEEHQRAAAGPARTGEPGAQMRERRRVEGRRVRDRVLLPRPHAGLHRQEREVGELRPPQKRRRAPQPRPLAGGLRVVPRGPRYHQEMVVPLAARQDPRLVPREEPGELLAVPGRGVEERRVEHVRQRVERRVVGHEHGVGAGRVVGEAVPLQDAAVEEGLQEPRVGAVPGAAARVRARAEAVVGERLAGRGRGGRRGRVGEREGVSAAVAEEVGVEARGKVADVDPAARTGVRPVGAGAGGGGDVEEEEEEEEGIGHFGEWPTEGGSGKVVV
ncbi:hypothetical protein SEVIR_9G334650v4 [Setaria viridis]